MNCVTCPSVCLFVCLSSSCPVLSLVVSGCQLIRTNNKVFCQMSTAVSNSLLVLTTDCRINGVLIVKYTNTYIVNCIVYAGCL